MKLLPGVLEESPFYADKLCKQARSLSHPCSPLTQHILRPDLSSSGEAVLYMLVIMAFYVALVVVMLVLNYGGDGERMERPVDGPKQVIHYDEGEGASNRLVEEGDDDERDNVVDV
eukprot:GFUD01053242.1.p1 GENE.GFUD01053242.1~~GFUD01053242.1.p1  ORF type:complete len:116 (-),score=35.01 GFUD01053242.1:11-358(-)